MEAERIEGHALALGIQPGCAVRELLARRPRHHVHVGGHTVRLTDAIQALPHGLEHERLLRLDGVPHARVPQVVVAVGLNDSNSLDLLLLRQSLPGLNAHFANVDLLHLVHDLPTHFLRLGASVAHGSALVHAVPVETGRVRDVHLLKAREHFLAQVAPPLEKASVAHHDALVDGLHFFLRCAARRHDRPERELLAPGSPLSLHFRADSFFTFTFHEPQNYRYERLAVHACGVGGNLFPPALSTQQQQNNNMIERAPASSTD